MEIGFRVVVETYNIPSNETLTRKEIDSFTLLPPKHIKEVGLDQQHQIKILQNIFIFALPADSSASLLRDPKCAVFGFR